MKKLMLLALLLLPVGAYANCGNGNGNGNGCSDEQGPAGPQGPKGDKGDQGNPGHDGSNGNNGQNGNNGANGKDGKDAPAPNNHFTESNLVADTAVRLYDGKRIQLQAFNVYALGRHQGDDLFGDGHNMMYGMRLVVKLGKSYEERLLEKQAKEIADLKRALYAR